MFIYIYTHFNIYIQYIFNIFNIHIYSVQEYNELKWKKGTFLSRRKTEKE